MENREIIFLHPVFTHNIWGGSRLGRVFGYDVEGADIGECWGIAAHEHGDCTIANGTYQGMRLSQLWAGHPELFGYVKSREFPLLVKIIDAKDDLSIQVHPSDAYAKVHEDGASGKTECWYILDCKKDSSIVIGHHAENRRQLQDMVLHKKWNELIREVPVEAGDFIQIEPGTMHAIRGGIMLLEIQQNSDITYRVYDYGRLWNGKPRMLQVGRSLDVITAPAGPDNVFHTSDLPKNKLHPLISCSCYHVWKLDLEGAFCIEQSQPFLLLNIIFGAGMVDGVKVQAGAHMILPYGYGCVRLEGKMVVIASTVGIMPHP